MESPLPSGLTSAPGDRQTPKFMGILTRGPGSAQAREGGWEGEWTSVGVGEGHNLQPCFHGTVFRLQETGCSGNELNTMSLYLNDFSSILTEEGKRCNWNTSNRKL